MLIARLVIVLVAAAIVVYLLMQNTGKWALSLQEYYVTQSNKLWGNSGGWDEHWRLSLFKALVIFSKLMTNCRRKIECIYGRSNLDASDRSKLANDREDAIAGS